MKAIVEKSNPQQAVDLILKPRHCALIATLAWLVINARDLIPKFIGALIVNINSSGTVRQFLQYTR